MRLLILGDTHGNERAAVRAVSNAKDNGATQIIQVGDFGLWPGFHGVKYLDVLNAALLQSNITLTWLDGNHEWFDGLDALVAIMPQNDRGQTYIRSNILYSPRGCAWKLDGKRFMTVGGAVSIDKSLREAGKSWWPQEQLTQPQKDGIVARANARRAAGRPEVDYLFTHDCHPLTPFKHRLKNDPDSSMHREMIRDVYDAVRPAKAFHGHMHDRYDWTLEYRRPFSDEDAGQTRVYGLECDGMLSSWGILDTEDDSFKWPSDIARKAQLA